MNIHKIDRISSQQIKRVAAYARVSTLAEEQQESLHTQTAYYETLIRQNPLWTFVGVYADPGRSGTSTTHRPEFLRLIDDARAGRIDLILVKSISRFARNILDAHNYARELKTRNVEVRFEREAISSFDPSSDMIFSVLAAVAQEESRALSENVKWSYQKNAEKGVRRIGSHRVLGYDETDGALTPNGDAWAVQLIFERYADGVPICIIIQELAARGARRLRSEQPFRPATVLAILRNEIYCGDRLLQKSPPRDYLTKKPDTARPYASFYVQDAHPPIVTADTWTRAQARLAATRAAREGGA